MATVSEPGQSLLHGVHVCIPTPLHPPTAVGVVDEKKPFHKDTNNVTSIH